MAILTMILSVILVITQGMVATFSVPIFTGFIATCRYLYCGKSYQSIFSSWVNMANLVDVFVSVYRNNMNRVQPLLILLGMACSLVLLFSTPVFMLSTVFSPTFPVFFVGGLMSFLRLFLAMISGLEQGPVELRLGMRWFAAGGLLDAAWVLLAVMVILCSYQPSLQGIIQANLEGWLPDIWRVAFIFVGVGLFLIVWDLWDESRCLFHHIGGSELAGIHMIRHIFLFVGVNWSSILIWPSSLSMEVVSGKEWIKSHVIVLLLWLIRLFIASQVIILGQTFIVFKNEVVWHRRIGVGFLLVVVGLCLSLFH